jgi:choline transporter-like protein 2/4/5
VLTTYFKSHCILFNQIAIELIEEGSKSVGQNFGSIFFPIVPFLLHVVVVAFFAGVAMFLSSW